MTEETKEIRKTRTLLARMRNLLEERSVDISPSIEEELETQLEQHRRSTKLRLRLEVEDLKNQKETIEEAFEIIRKRRGIKREEKAVFAETLNDLEEEIQDLESKEPEDVMGDPDRI